MPRAHATLQGLAERARLQDLAEAASENRAVDAELLEALIDGSDVSGYAADVAAAGRDAVERLQRDIDDANTQVDGYLSRYPKLDATADLAPYAYDIAVWRILGGEKGSERYERYAAALKYLGRVASGEINLDLDDSETSGAAASRARHSASTPLFRRESLAGL